jgi:alanine racemase
VDQVVVTMVGDAPAVLTVDLNALAANYATVQREAPRSRVAAVLKANAYGLGVGPVARRLAREGCGEYFVSSLFEGQELRAVLPDARVYVLEGASGAISACRRAGLVPVLNTLQEVEEWIRECSGAPAALQVDTGMTRAGLSAEDVRYLAASGAFVPFRPELLLTHLACADDATHPLNAEQLVRFAQIRGAFPGVPTSIGNSAGIWLGPDYQGDVVRPGIALYGGRPQARGLNPVRPVARLTARVLQVRELRTAAAVGYGATVVMPAGARIATVGAGYADGLPRALGGRGSAYLNGQLVPLVGRVSMDLTTLDVTALGAEGCRVGDDVELLGATMTLEAVAEYAGTVGYEVLTRLSPRLPRRYIGSD